jgi:hypothetical protein
MARIRTALTVSLISLTVVGMAIAAGTSMSASRSTATTATGAAALATSLAASAKTQALFDRTITATTLSRVGLGPEQLAAAGLTGEETELLIGRMMVHLSAHNSNGEIQQATRALNQGVARATRGPQPRRVQDAPLTPGNRPAGGSGDAPGGTPAATPPGSPDQPSSPSRPANPRPAPTPEPLPDLDNLRLNLTSKLDLAFSAALQGLPPFKSQRLVNMRANAKWELPLFFLVVAPDSRTPQEWLQVKASIAHVGSAAQRGWTPDSEVVARFNAAADASEVAEARNNLGSRLTEIKTAWDAILDPE